MNEKSKNTIELRQAQLKEKLIEQLKKTPIIQIACEKTEISRASYYRWKKEDQDFAAAADAAIEEGAALVTDLAESQLISAIRERNFGAVVFWLKHHHPVYATRIELTAKTPRETAELTEEQKELIKKSIILFSQEEGQSDTQGLETVPAESPIPAENTINEDVSGNK